MVPMTTTYLCFCVALCGAMCPPRMPYVHACMHAGTDIRDFDPIWLRTECVGMAPQKPAIYRGTLRSNITYGSEEKWVRFLARLVCPGRCVCRCRSPACAVVLLIPRVAFVCVSTPFILVAGREDGHRRRNRCRDRKSAGTLRHSRHVRSCENRHLFDSLVCWLATSTVSVCGGIVVEWP